MSIPASASDLDTSVRAAPKGRWALWSALVVLLAFLLREYFVLAAVVDQPIRGDIREYVYYAWNLHYHGVFGMTPPGADAAVPDAYRSPGYPWLLALCMALRPSGPGWYALALQFQVVLGTLTVWLTMIVGRQWMRPGWALAAGVLLAFWPHHIAATGTLLSEVAFGFALMAALAVTGFALRSARIAWYAAAGAMFGLAYLVNPLIALFPIVPAWVLGRRRGVRAALLFALPFLVAVGGFALRNAQLPAPDHARPGRAAINFAQGSWPQYHLAWAAQAHGDAIGHAVITAIDDEVRLLSEHPDEGLRTMAARMAREPLYYGPWYLWEKPLLLWDWEIRLGPGGPYVLEVRQSPLERNPGLRLIGGLLHRSNPLISLVTLAAMFALTWRWRRASTTAQAVGFATAALGLYLTLIHDVFQAEPRYANAYRGIEMLVFVAGIGYAAGWIRRRIAPHDTKRHEVTHRDKLQGNPSSVL